jgi:hypothetical protein
MSKREEIYLDILHIYRSETVAGFVRFGRRMFYGTSFFEKIQNVIRFKAKMFRDFIVSIFGRKNNSSAELQQKDWLYVLGGNNYHSLKFLEDPKTTVYVSPFKYQTPDVKPVQIILSNHFMNMLRCLPTFVALSLKNKDIRRCWDIAFKATGMYESSLTYLKKHQPRSIIFSNDHSLEPRAMLLAANKLNIPTFYVQHACIRTDFPPLKFTCSFLEGQDSLDKYRGSGAVEGQVELIGVPRIEAYLPKKRTRKTIKHIGLCSNLLDSLPVIEEVMKELRLAFPDHHLSYRPHPVDKRSIELDSSISISNSKIENPFEFLLKQDLIIAGNTSIHYEAAMLNVYTVCYKLGIEGKTEDMYGFVKKELVTEVSSPEALVSLIKKSAETDGPDLKIVKYYNAVLNTANEGKSQDLVK